MSTSTYTLSNSEGTNVLVVSVPNPMQQSSLQGQPPDNVDPDPLETSEWLDELLECHPQYGPKRGQFLVGRLEEALRDSGAPAVPQPFSAYRNSIPLERLESFTEEISRSKRGSPQSCGGTPL